MWSRSSGVELRCGKHSLVFKKLDISAMRYWGCIRHFYDRSGGWSSRAGNMASRVAGWKAGWAEGRI